MQSFDFMPNVTYFIAMEINRQFKKIPSELWTEEYQDFIKHKIYKDVGELVEEVPEEVIDYLLASNSIQSLEWLKIVVRNIDHFRFEYNARKYVKAMVGYQDPWEDPVDVKEYMEENRITAVPAFGGFYFVKFKENLNAKS